MLFVVERHLRRTGEPPTVLGRRAVGDPNLVKTLRNGRELRPATEKRLHAYLLAAGARVQ
ncbi:hypothetical protein [Sphingomonas sp.]|jgi:hypothetical protein|uniref:hypothetical protein n=1 Tax=Sphingomonas sp. TaxID=28214 RepID=UPI003B3AB745